MRRSDQLRAKCRVLRELDRLLSERSIRTGQASNGKA